MAKFAKIIQKGDWFISFIYFKIGMINSVTSIVNVFLLSSATIVFFSFFDDGGTHTATDNKQISKKCFTTRESGAMDTWRRCCVYSISV